MPAPSLLSYSLRYRLAVATHAGIWHAFVTITLLGLHGSGFFGEFSAESVRKRKLSVKSRHKEPPFRRT